MIQWVHLPGSLNLVEWRLSFAATFRNNFLFFIHGKLSSTVCRVEMDKCSEF